MKKQLNKKALVTGGNSGIGFATAKELIAEGAEVIITGRNKSAVDSAAKEIGAIGVVADQGSLAAIDSLAATIKSKFEKLDILVLNAGVYSIAPFEMVSESSYDSVMDINLKGVFFTLQKFVPLLNEGASVVLISSVAALASPGAGQSVYSASKAAMNSLVRSISFELAPKGIRVNAVCPGPTDTPVFGKVGLSEEALGQLATAIQNKIPVKRFGAASDIAKLVSFISSDDGSFINGSEYVIDGGLINVPIMS
jgi:NAD(P)-dependent dehydrogenase (short-subunit alcohol dehydrogenase family)